MLPVHDMLAVTTLGSQSLLWQNWRMNNSTGIQL